VLQSLESKKEATPHVVARLVVARGSIQTLVEHCPYCGGTHMHGGSGLDKGDPRSAYSGRPLFSHCHGGGYILVPSLEPAAFFEKAANDPRARSAMARLKQIGISTSACSVYLPPTEKRGRW
jgi:hypothetical protein